MMFCITRCRRAGFTLIEIMIVIAIIAILAGIAIPDLRRSKEEAMHEACGKNCETIANALVMVLARVPWMRTKISGGMWDLMRSTSGGQVSTNGTAYPGAWPGSGYVDWAYAPKFVEEYMVPYGYLDKAPKCPKRNNYVVCYGLIGGIWFYRDYGTDSKGCSTKDTWYVICDGDYGHCLDTENHWCFRIYAIGLGAGCW